ncbi:MAG: Ig-like domain-containing protein [bacterium]
MLFSQMLHVRGRDRFMPKTRAVGLFALASFSLLLSLRAALAQTPVFINEIHYDNTGADANEAIEIAGPAGTDLTGWSIVLYNGSNGAVYDTDALNGTIPNLCNGFGVVMLNYPANGIQNGAPDGIALVNPSNAVIQFLSYEGSFTATAGPANGMVSTDIGVAEAGTEPPGQSLQLSGTGQFYENFTWNAPAASTFGACNTGQNFVSGDTAPSVTTTTPNNNATNVAVNTNITITFSEAVNASGTWFRISGNSSGSHTTTVSGGPTTFTLDPDIDFANNENVSVTVFAANIADQDADDPPDTMAANFNFSFTTIAGDVAPEITSTTPGNGASGVDANTNLTITFSEPVNVSGSWFSINGSVSGAHTATVSGGPTNFTLDPDVDFVTNETVTVNIFASNVTDQDASDPPDNMATDYTFSFTTPSLIINEILADPSSTAGDANGDSTINTAQDEFIELVNVSGAALDISGWTLSDATQVRHTFPAGTTVTNQCGIVVFGGGTPMGSFGNTTVQTASTNQLSLNNAGDTITLKNGSIVITMYTYGPEGGNDQSLTRDPDITGPTLLVQHTNATGAGGRLYSPGIRVGGAQFPGCQPSNITKEIFEIQGSGLVSPFANQNITTENNVVTVVGSNGFFMQTPAARSDNGAQTSDGIFVFTGSTPAVSAGDLVNVTGDVVEFFNFTEFGNNPTVTKISSGNPLPPAIQFDDLTPSPNQPQAATAYERFEGMLVQIANGVVAASNQTFGSDPIAEVLIVAGPNRPFREPGVEYPGLPSLPVWDRNPEIFEFDPDRLGQPNMAIPAGSTFSATGVLGFEFGGYELWPTSYAVNAAALPRAVRARNTGESTIATLNLHLLYDDIDDPGINEPVRTPQAYADKLNKLSLYIRTLLGAPDILAVQEAEKLKVLQDLANKINTDDALLTYTPYLIEGNDVSGIDAGFLLRRGVTVNAVMQLGATEVFTPNNTPLHDRPPLLLHAKLADSSAVSVLAVHLRSLNGIDDPNDGPRVRQKRHEQAVSVSHMVQNLQIGNPNIKLAVAGDFNAFQFTDGYVHVLGQIMGTPASASEALIPGTDHVNPDLANAVLSLPVNEQYSFVFAGSAQVLDHILISQAFQSSVTGIQYARANSDAAEIFETDGTTALRASDHDGLVLFVKSSPTNEVVDSNPLSVTSYELTQNYPNPFSAAGRSRMVGYPITMINFALPEAGKVTVKIFAETGQLVQTLVNGEMSAGRHQLHWNGQNQSGSAVAAGVYLYRIVVQGRNGEVIFSETKRMTLLK